MPFGIVIICCSIFYSLMVGTVYFSKNRLKTTENKIYSFLIKINFIGLLIELACCFLVMNRDGTNLLAILNEVFNRFFIIYLLTWEITFTTYIFFISFNIEEEIRKKLEKNKTKIFVFIILIYSVMAIITCLLPIYYYSDTTFVYSYGPATNFITIIGGICIIFDIYCLVKNYKNIWSKKYHPLFILIFLMIFVIVLRNINPGIIIINSVFAFVTNLMFFTIENPDLQMVEELLKNRKLTEKSLEEKSITLLTLSQKIRLPLKEIKDTINLYNKSENLEEKDFLVDKITQDINSLNFIANDVLNISTMDVSKIKMIDSEYSTDYFFKDIEKKTELVLKDKNIDFKMQVKKSFPKKLYGDYVKIKQVIMTVINYLVKNINEGYLDVDFDCIIRYDTLRLFIDIKSSGEKIPLEEINELMKYEATLTDEEFKKIDKLNVDLSLAIKIIRVLGGSINIKSDIENVFSIVIDQKIKLEKENFIIKKINTYQHENLKNNQIVIVVDKVNELKKLNELFSKYNVIVTTCLSGNELLSRLNNNEKYNLILLKDEMDQEKAYMILKKLQEIKNKIPVVVMLNKDKEMIYKNYLEEGFSDIIKNYDLENEVKRICNKYM